MRLGPASSRAASTLNEQGLSLSPKPDGDVPNRLPRDLTALSDEQLMQLYSFLTAWADYITTQLACAQVDERNAQRILDDTENRLMIANGSKGERVTYARAQVAADPSITSLRDVVEESHAYRRLVEALAHNVDRNSVLVSRELTRRTSNKTRSSRW